MRAAVLVLAVSLAGCADRSEPPPDAAPDAAQADGGAPFDAAIDAARIDAAIDAPAEPADAGSDAAPLTPDGGMPITAPERTWTWVDVEGTACSRGTTTGIGVSLAEGAPGVLVLLMGGGACWDDATCNTLRTATEGPFGAAEFAATSAAFAGSILDRDLAGSPFADWSMVFVPYCTGDWHAGTRVADYAGGTWHHVGRTNLEAILPRLAATFPPSTPIAWVGASSGGFGAVLDHDLVRTAFPSAPLYIVDDSGPLLVGDAIPASLRTAIRASWGLGWLDATCPECASDLSAAYALAAADGGRIALLSHTRDATMAAYFMQDAATFEASLRTLVTALDAVAGVETFVVTGTAHTILPTRPSAMAPDGTTALGWISEMVSGAPAWSSH